VLSSTYQQASRELPEMRQRDPENAWLWTFTRRRIEYEALRDGLWFVSGGLDTALYGPSVDLAQSPLSPRRALYALIDRQNLPGAMRTFDFASPDTHSPQRYSTTVPQQALFLLNHPLLLDRATALAAHPAAQNPEPARRIEQLYALVLSRLPSSEELELGAQYLAAELAVPDAPPALAWARYAQALLLSNEFVFVD
jgi:hypothetical protein